TFCDVCSSDPARSRPRVGAPLRGATVEGAAMHRTRAGGSAQASWAAECNAGLLGAHARRLGVRGPVDRIAILYVETPRMRRPGNRFVGQADGTPCRQAGDRSRAREGADARGQTGHSTRRPRSLHADAVAMEESTRVAPSPRRSRLRWRGPVPFDSLRPRRKDAAPMRRLVLVAVLAAGSFAAPPARADGKPDAAHIAKASSEFDAGVVQFRKKDYEGAGAHFEAADAAAPSPNALRQAIRARSQAGQGARAATLAAAALARYAHDAATTKVARDAIEKFEPVLHKVHVQCASPCTLSIVAGEGTTRVPGEPAKSWVVYLDPGSVTIASSFVDAGGASVDGPAEPVEAKVGGEVDLHFDATPKPAPTAAPPPVAAPPPTVPSKPDPAPDEPKTEEPKAEGNG